MSDSCKPTVHVGDTGTVLRKTVPGDISAATTVELIVIDAGGNRTVLTGTLPGGGGDGVAEFTSTADTWQVAGMATEQMRIVMPSGEWRTTVRQRLIGPKT